MTVSPIPPAIGGYVLAGGKSLRMGTDKALLELAGSPLIAHAVAKLRRICKEVHILSRNPALASFAPLVPDRNIGTGPIGGIEAALAHSRFAWNLILPVDVPFLPRDFLERWARSVLADEGSGVRVALFTVHGIPQPTILLMHREVAPSVAQAIERGESRLFPILEAAGQELAGRHGLSLESVFRNTVLEAPPLWFANLNTPEDFAVAAENVGSIDPLGP